MYIRSPCDLSCRLALRCCVGYDLRSFLHLLAVSLSYAPVPSAEILLHVAYDSGDREPLDSDVQVRILRLSDYQCFACGKESQGCGQGASLYSPLLLRCSLFSVLRVSVQRVLSLQ